MVVGCLLDSCRDGGATKKPRYVTLLGILTVHFPVDCIVLANHFVEWYECDWLVLVDGLEGQRLF